MKLSLLCATLLFACAAYSGEPENPRVIDSKIYHLGTEGLPEWEEFEKMPLHGRRLDVTFQADENAEPCTLFLRQENVKFPWTVQINAKKIGVLETIDAAQIDAFAVPAGTLKKGENTLSIVPPAATEDILVGDFRLDPRPREKALRQATLLVRVIDSKTQWGLPCRITLATKDEALVPFIDKDRGEVDPAKLITTRTGVAYTHDGIAALGVMPGEYIVYATRGFEYSMPTQQISIAAGEAKPVELQIEREVPTPGLIACDTHIHTLTHSGHGDATVDERMLTIAGEGIELAISTEHNHHADYSVPQQRTGMQSEFTAVIGNEVTTKAGHFNIFPVSAGSKPPDDKIEDWAVLLQAMRGTPGVQVITLNHPRDMHTNFTPFGPQNLNPLSGEHYRIEDFAFDAVEVVTSAALQSDIELQYRDWFALLNHGFRTSGIGSSDSHDVNRFILGQGRTYVVCDDSKPGQIDIAQVCKSFREGRVAASMGLLADLRVNERFSPGDLATGLGEQITVTATVLGPSWINADRIELFANGNKIKEERIEATRGVTKAKYTWTLPRPAQDTHLVAIATGPGVTSPAWAIPRPYQPTSKNWIPRVIGSTNPIWIDADGDGKYSSPRETARKLLAQAKNDSDELLLLLAKHDRAVAVQAASLCHAANMDVESAHFKAVLLTAPDFVQSAFGDYLKSLKEHEEALKPQKK